MSREGGPNRRRAHGAERLMNGTEDSRGGGGGGRGAIPARCPRRWEGSNSSRRPGRADRCLGAGLKRSRLMLQNVNGSELPEEDETRAGIAQVVKKTGGGHRERSSAADSWANAPMRNV
ncbi:hypothetical protein PR202_gb07526 [Eleusine coracana subsp. coracana]|uniref:Uncharacterized protein n=1 Tax=Eleusine coracana subsp. coracana TaxID=191504 RepID=A0AAV5ECF1_ELECO|nr:hypothetical protein PR202_gb07526 [Eleusine coracana subsp. coracana]